MLRRRLIVNLLWRSIGIVQSRGFEHTNVVGDLKVAINCFNAWEADEIILLNVERDDTNYVPFVNALRHISSCCFLPLSVGGWINNIDRVKQLLDNGADKVVVNTHGLLEPDFISTIARQYGSQCIIASIDVRGNKLSGYEVFVDRGRQKLGISPFEALNRVANAGAGEVMITSIDRDGSLSGYDEFLLRHIVAKSPVPVISFGGVGSWQHLADGLANGADAVAAGNIFHHSDQSTRKAKRFLRSTEFLIR